MQTSLVSHRYVPIPVHTAPLPEPNEIPRKNKLSKAFANIKKAFKHPKHSEPIAPFLFANAQPAPLEAGPAPTIILPSPTPLLPLDDAIQGIDRQLASMRMARTDHVIATYDRKLAAFYGKSIDDTQENAASIQEIQTWIKERNTYASFRNLYAQGKVPHPTHNLHGPANERAQKHINRLDDTASALNDAMSSILQKSAGRVPTAELENSYLGAHKALGEHRNAWLTGELDESSKTSLKVLALTDRLKSRGIPVPNSSAMQSSQFRKQLEQNVTNERLKFDHQPTLFTADSAAAQDAWSSDPFNKLDSSSPPAATGAQFSITHSPITTKVSKNQAERIQRHVAALEKEIAQIDGRLEGLANGRPDPLQPEQLQFIRNAISQLRNSWAAGELTLSSSIGKVLNGNIHDLRRRELEQAVILAKALDSTATEPVAINPALDGSALAMTQSNVQRYDEALAEFDRALYKAQHSGIEGVRLSRNAFEGREAVMKLRNAWANGELFDAPPGAKPKRPSADERRRELELQVTLKALILLEVKLPRPSALKTNHEVLEGAKFCNKSKIIKDINYDLTCAFEKMDPTFKSPATSQAALAPEG
ncbi:hypothetical protein J1G35_12920 [Pseudomonas sp. SH10-3B]|uniref:hypothetical protein n=1 Tax=Pseudomonas sp. SH10-3B TaxID=2816049 RepID=UPI001CA6F204|nr:hypothetical protein [Pseudomonas sp. SH10-3B]MBY8946767.1 hypothetical protein [Pseudomonas sp. SH10-3B]